MRKTLAVSTIIVALGAVVAAFAVPALAHSGPDGDRTAPPNQEAWDTMYDACVNGDWEGMVEAMEDVFGDMPCFGGDYYTPNGEETQAPGAGWGGGSTGGWSGHMGGGMMGGWGGHMGW